jgi:hypothetical protein
MLLGGTFKTNVGGRCGRMRKRSVTPSTFTIITTANERFHLAALYKPMHQRQSTMILRFFRTLRAGSVSWSRRA